MKALLSPLLCLFVLLSACQEDPVLDGTPQDLTQNPGNPISASPSPENTPTPNVGNPDVQLAGVVRNSSTGALLANATVRVNDQATRTDSAGFYRLSPTQTGAVKLIVIQEGFQPYTATLELRSGSQIQDIDLQAADQNVATPVPTASEGPIVLLPDGSASVMPPRPTPSASPTPAPTPVPTATPAWDPILDEAAQSDVLIRRRGQNQLELVFTLQRVNGLPVNWEWGQVLIDYNLGNPLNANSCDNAEFLTSGRSVINANGEGFVINLGSKEPENPVCINYTLTLPNREEIEQLSTTVAVGG
ncbi:MAG: carboxypeptidase-like regulatory domain-containing protein [Candidatus Sericytochromatia bacterium]